MPAHLQEAALRFLRGLRRHNDRTWFEDRRDLYELHLREPMLAIVAEITEAMTDFAPAHVRPPHKSFMRIYRDIRFSKDKRPYKTNVAAWWVRTGLEKTSGGGFYLEINPDHITVAAGVYMPEREQLLAIRRYLSGSGGNHHGELRQLLNAPRLKKLLQPIEGHPLTRPPKGFLPDDPALDLILPRQWGVSSQLPASLALEPRLIPEVVRRFRLAAPVVDLLNQPLLPDRRRTLF